MIALASRVKLNDIVNVMDVFMPEQLAYLDRETGEVFQLTYEDRRAAEHDEPLEEFPEWQRKDIELAIRVQADWQRYLRLPNQWDIDELHIMGKYTSSVEDERIQNDLWKALDGREPFRRFREEVRRHGLQESWDDYRWERLQHVARDWCEDKGLEWK